jgi:hypothetical protein
MWDQKEWKQETYIYYCYLAVRAKLIQLGPATREYDLQ